GSLAFTINPGPQLTSITPTSAVAGSPDLTLTANGSNFSTGAYIQWTPNGGSSLNITPNSVTATQVSATIRAAQLASANTVQVSVVSGGITTTPQTFTITANASIGPVSVTPASGSGSSQTFQFVYTDSYGWNDLTSTWVYITGTFSSPLTNRCHMYSSGSSLYLLNDAGTAWMPGAIGSNATLQNSQCSLDLRNVSVTPSGNNLTLTVPIMFTSAFAGAKQVWMYAGSARGSTGWQQLGTWTVTAGSQLGSISPSTAIAGSGPTTLTANGSGFVGGASIRWTPANGSTAVLPATL